MIQSAKSFQRKTVEEGGKSSLIHGPVDQKPTFNDIKNNQIAKRRDACQ